MRDKRNAHHPLIDDSIGAPTLWAHSEIATISFQMSLRPLDYRKQLLLLSEDMIFPPVWIDLLWQSYMLQAHVCLFFNDALSDCITLMTTIDGSDGSSQCAIPFHGQWWWLNDDPRARSGCHGGMSCVFVFVIEKNHILQVFSRDLTCVTTMWPYTWLHGCKNSCKYSAYKRINPDLQPK